MAKMRPIRITLYARVGDSEVLNEIATIERDLEVAPITDENRRPGDAEDATMRIDIALPHALRQIADEIEATQ